MSSIDAAAVAAARSGSGPSRGCRRLVRIVRCSSGSSMLELVVQLQAADLRQVVALGVEEQVVEQVSARSRASADRPGAGAGRSP